MTAFQYFAYTYVWRSYTHTYVYVYLYLWTETSMSPQKTTIENGQFSGDRASHWQRLDQSGDCCRGWFWIGHLSGWTVFLYFCSDTPILFKPKFWKTRIFSRALNVVCSSKVPRRGRKGVVSTSKPATRTIRVSVHRWYIKNELITCAPWRSILCMCKFATYFVIDVVVCLLCMMCILIMCHNMWIYNIYIRCTVLYIKHGSLDSLQVIKRRFKGLHQITELKTVGPWWKKWWMRTKWKRITFLVGKPIDFKATDFSHSRHFLLFI